MRWAAGSIALPMMLVVLGGCPLPSFQGDSGSQAPRRLEEFEAKGPFPVHGVSPRSPGPRLFQQILKAPQLTAFLRSQKNPDTLEVVAAQNGNLQVLLVYSRPSNPPGRRIVIERVGDRLSAYPPTRLDGTPLGSGRPPPAGPRVEEAVEEEVEAEVEALPETPSAEIQKPTEIENLECPIDPERPDCLALCVPGAPYEWCL